MAVTHYVPYFTPVHRYRVRLVRAACGQTVTFPEQHSTVPTCPRCEAWLQADTTEAAALAELWEMEAAAKRRERTA